MAGLGYQAVQPASFDVTDIAAQADANKLKEQQLALQAMKARQAGEAKDKKTTLKTPWNYFAGVVGQASISLTDEMRQLESITNPTEKAAKKAEIEQKWENLAMFSEYTNGLKDNYNSINSKLGDNYYIEDKREFGNLPAELAQQTTFENGEIFIGGIPWKEAAASLRFQEPTPIYKDLFYEFSKENPPSKFLVQQGNVYVRNDEYLETTVQGAAENAIKLGYPESVVQEFVDNVITVYPKTRSLPDREGGGGITIDIGGGKKVKSNVGVSFANLRGVDSNDIVGTAAQFSDDVKLNIPREIEITRQVNGQTQTEKTEEVFPVNVSKISYQDGKFEVKAFGYRQKQAVGASLNPMEAYMMQQQPSSNVISTEPTEPITFTPSALDMQAINQKVGFDIFDVIKSKAEKVTKRTTQQSTKQQETVWIYGGEEYTLKELQDTYGKDFNPSEYDGFQQKK